MADLQMTPQELKQQLDAGRAPRLLDVREPWEHETAALPNSTLIPLGELHERAGELDPQEELVVYCHHGVRSLHAIGLLRQRGFTKLRNLQGGIDAWSAVDPSVPRY